MKKACLNHDWYPMSQTHGHWYGKGWGTYKHQACKKCQFVDFREFIPDPPVIKSSHAKNTKPNRN